MRNAVSRWPLVARGSQVEDFAQVWESPDIRTVAVWGPPGIGKTRLAEEFLQLAVRRGARTGHATATAAASAVALGAIAHLIPAGIGMDDPVAGYAEVARALADRRTDQPWVLFVDDVHLLDAASAVLLRQLLDADLVRLICTSRAGEPVSEAVGALCHGDEVFRVDLAEMDVTEVEALLAAVLGGPVDRRAVQTLSTASGGNPLYLRELVRGALADGSLSDDGEIWQLAERPGMAPPALVELIEAHLSAAPAEARPVLELLALCEPLPAADVLDLIDPEGLADLEESSLLSVVRDGRRRTVDLAHPLYGEVLRSRIPEVRRHTLLTDQVRRTESRGTIRQDDMPRITAWQLAASGSADPGRLVQAARLARYARDHRQAVSLLEALPESARTSATWLSLGELSAELGRHERADEAFEAAYAAAGSEQEVVAVLTTRAFSTLWSPRAFDPALSLYETARRRVTSAGGRRTLRHLEGATRVVAGEVTAGLALLADLPDGVDDAGDPLGWVTAALGKTIGLTLAGQTDQAMVLGARLGEPQAAGVDLPFSVSEQSGGMTLFGLMLRVHGRLTQAREVAEQDCATQAEADTTVLRIYATGSLAAIEWQAGHVATARRWFAETASLARAGGNERVIRGALSGLAACAALLGDLPAAERACKEARDFPSGGLDDAGETIGPAWLAAARGDLAGARDILAEAAATSREHGLFPSEATILTDMARLGAPGQVVERLAELARTCEGDMFPAQWHLAEALAADDPVLLLASAEELRGIGADLPAAEAATAAAKAWHRLGENRKATAASQLADSCAGRCEEARTPLLAEAETVAPLTARQHDIAVMAANGTASRDIAESLHLSVRTVDSHLRNVYTRLGVTNRRELADALGIRRWDR